MMHKFIVCDPDKCVGCQFCEFICAMTKNHDFQPYMSRIRNVRIEPVTMLTVSCRMCEDPSCVLACPRKALTQSKEDGVILVDDEKCDGCGWCIEACEFGAIVINSDKKTVEICDLCADKDQPQCVVYCPKDALELSTPEIVAQKARRDVVGKLLQELAKR